MSQNQSTLVAASSNHLFIVNQLLGNWRGGRLFSGHLGISWTNDMFPRSDCVWAWQY